MTTRCEDCNKLFIVATVCPRCAEIRRGDVTVLQQANWALNYELDESSKTIAELRAAIKEACNRCDDETARTRDYGYNCDGCPLHSWR